MRDADGRRLDSISVPSADEVATDITDAGTTLHGTITSETSAAITAAVNALIGGAPGALDTLNELAAAINDDASFAASVTTALGTKAAAADLTAEIALARNADNLTSGTVADARIASTIARDTEVTAELLSKPLIRPNTVAILGASIAEMAGGGGAGVYDTAIASPYTRADGYFPWANASLGGRLTMVKNAGVGGERSDQILARVTDVTNLATLPGYCILSDMASNDLLQSVASATIIANVSAICDALQAKGITIVICTVLPLAGTNAHLQRQAEVNRWIRDRVGQPGFIVCDWAARWTDPTTVVPRTGLSTDGTHPTALGAGAIGKVLADAIRPHLGGSIHLASHNLDQLTSNLNPMMVGTGGTASTGTSGSVATNWTTLRGTGSGTLTAAKVARTDNIGGEWQSLTLAGGGGQFFLYSDVASGAVAGQKWQTEMEFINADFSGITNCQVVCQDGPGTGTQSCYALYQAGPSALTPDITAGVLRTPVFTVPSGGPANLRTMLIFQGTAGSIMVSRFRTRRIA